MFSFRPAGVALFSTLLFAFCYWLAGVQAHDQHVLGGQPRGGDYAELYALNDQQHLYARRNWNVRTPGDHPQKPIKPPEERNLTLLPLVFEPLPLGSIKPLGWLRDQLQLMADGLPGHLFEFYRLVKDAPWMGGNQEYSPLNEAFPYFFNGLVPLAYSLDNERLKKQVLTAADYIIAHQHTDGWLGPETDSSRRNFWGRYPLFLGLAQLIEAEPSTGPSILPAMHGFVNLMHEMMSNGHQGYVWKPGDQFDEQWGRSRAADMVIALQWLYEKHPRGNERKIHDCMMFVYEQAYDWSYWFSEDIFIKDDLDLFPIELTNSLFPYLHGVNAGQGLKYGGVMRRLVHDDDLLNSTRNGVNWTFQHHGAPSGGIIGDERESGLSPVRAVELCSVVETMFSLTYLQQAMGDNSFADKAELAAFNALPAMIRPHWWAHQYVAQTNQPISHHLENKPFWNVGPEGQTFGLEPNYPCCTVDFSQGYPKFLSASFVRSGDDGIAHALLGPAEVRTTTTSGSKVKISCKTNYPFSMSLSYDITSSAPFTFSVRVPSWANLNGTSLIVSTNGKKRHHELAPCNHTGMQSIPLGKGMSEIHLNLDTSIRVEHRANATVSIHHGPLLYAIAPAFNAVGRRPARYPGTSAPPDAMAWTLTPTEPWNLAIDPSTLRFFDYNNGDGDAPLPNPIWAHEAPPTMISALACEIAWNLTSEEGGYAPIPPPVRGEGVDSSVVVNPRKCIGRSFPVGLRPYGGAELHMAELPTVDLSPGSPDHWHGVDGNDVGDTNEL